jgi:hypothetical protein
LRFSKIPIYLKFVQLLEPFGWRVQQIYFDAKYGYHIDVLMPVIREGLIAVGKSVLLLPRYPKNCRTGK